MFLAGALILSLAGCQVVHDVTIDAISNTAKPLGTSYRLDLRDLTGGVEKELQAEALGRVREALAARGLYEAPASVKPDMDIRCEYGVGQPHIKILYNNSGVGLTPELSEPNAKPIIVYDKFIKLSAREPATGAHGNPAKPDEELWSVHATIEDTKKDLSPYLPVLAAACVSYIGQSSAAERHLLLKADEAPGLLGRVNPPPKDSR